MKDKFAHPAFREKLYNLFKYTIYLLLMWNTYLFFQQDWDASSHTFQDGVHFSQIIEAFTASADTLNWVILLLLFELETWVISDEALEKKHLKWSLMAVRSLCYSLILYAFYGYYIKLMLFYGVTPFPVEDVCSMVDGVLSKVIALDEYEILTAENCQSLAGLDLFKIQGQALIADAQALADTRELAWIDVINAGTWIWIVVVLEVDVWFQLKGLLKGPLLRISKFFKAALYISLLVCAIIWGILGEFLDFWDAFLWLVAFAFIEMNLFQWQQEIKENKAARNQTSP
ncbi:hypothetical protein [Emcibacter sp.]|uniref:hypothetical protein n=1 Tax=Emcibacter sp. TaxID=1979954 RepID=UPI002AA93861|nr:hypothetical protein [Emcibacter sp.]